MADNDMPKKAFTWKRFLRYWYVRLLRINDNPRSIAMGVGLGLFIGFLVPIGLQTIVVIPVALKFKANKILSVAFTWVTNHLSVLIIYPIQCYVGSLVIFHPLKFEVLQNLFKKVDSFGMFKKVICSVGTEIIVSFFVGGLLFGIITGVAGYCLSYGAVIRYKESRRQKMRQKLMSKREH